MLNVLMPCTFYTGYVVQLRAYLKKYHSDIKISILTCKNSEKAYADEVGSLDPEEKIYTYGNHTRGLIDLHRIIGELPQFDIIHFLWMERPWCIFAGSLRKKCGAVYVSVGGSDLYRDSRRIWNNLLQKRLVRLADIISSENSQTRAFFASVHGNVSKGKEHRVIRFGVDVIEAINDNYYDKTTLKRDKGIPEDRIVVVCGHNARREHQHEKMIEAIAKLDRYDLDRLFLIFPMTYGSPDGQYTANVEKKLAKITSNYHVLREYMNTDQMAELAVITDVFVHVQTTDQLSSAMMAGMYCENIVIAGSWLPYEDIKASGIKFWEVDSVEELTGQLCDIINNTAQYRDEVKDNADKVYRFSSWEHCSKEWYSAYKTITG